MLNSIFAPKGIVTGSNMAFSSSVRDCRDGNPYRGRRREIIPHSTPTHAPRRRASRAPACSIVLRRPQDDASGKVIFSPRFDFVRPRVVEPRAAGSSPLPMVGAPQSSRALAVVDGRCALVALAWPALGIVPWIALQIRVGASRRDASRERSGRGRCRLGASPWRGVPSCGVPSSSRSLRHPGESDSSDRS